MQNVKVRDRMNVLYHHRTVHMSNVSILNYFMYQSHLKHSEIRIYFGCYVQIYTNRLKLNNNK